MERILILGGGGFIGSHLCEKAGSLNCRITVPTRRMVNAKSVLPLPWVDVIEADIHDEQQLGRLVRGHDAVVNLVAILHGNTQAFDHVHVALVQKLLRACQAAKVARLVHVSALGAAPDAPSLYQRSKAQGEAALGASSLDVTILRPSVVFGAEDRFLNLFARLQAVFPVMPLACAGARFQPVWVQDVARAIVNTLANRAAVGALDPRTGTHLFEACGPDVFTLRELVQLAGRLSGHPRPVIALSPKMARLQARVMEWLPGAPMISQDNLASMQVDNVASGVLPGLAELGVVASSVHAIAPSYLNSALADPLLARRQLSGRL